MSGELTPFEQQSTLIPKKMVYAILGGTVFFVIVLALINTFAPNTAVSDMKEKAEAAQAADAPAATQDAGSGSSLDDL